MCLYVCLPGASLGINSFLVLDFTSLIPLTSQPVALSTLARRAWSVAQSSPGTTLATCPVLVGFFHLLPSPSVSPVEVGQGNTGLALL